MDAVKSEEQMAQEAKATEDTRDSKPQPGLGGLLGGLLKEGRIDV